MVIFISNLSWAPNFFRLCGTTFLVARSRRLAAIALAVGGAAVEVTKGQFLMSEKDESKDRRSMSSAQQITRSNQLDAPAELGNEIAKQLRALYGKQVSEPLPEKFANLLDQLAKSERKG
ncbi:MAG: NepR family anti-sigma factor [Hyphomicrobiaceae bacterium]